MTGSNEMNRFICEHPWYHFEVNNPNGDVTMCCDSSVVLGNVNQQGIDEIWNGPGFREIRRRMREEGAHVLCPHTCPVLRGGKAYVDLSWARELAPESSVRRNALLAEEDYASGSEVVRARPRWLRFAWSYACNLDCYHCYQREEAVQHTRLPDAFLADVAGHADTAQVIFPFGGEPFLFKPVLELLEGLSPQWDGGLCFVTNGTLVTDRVRRLVEARRLWCAAVSLDAASETTFDALRRRGRKAAWRDVLATLAWLRRLKEDRTFHFHVSMTVNRQNAHEIETFVDLALAYGAEPLLLLVSNPHRTAAFQAEYLTFSPATFAAMFAAIDRSLARVRAAGLRDSEIYLDQLRAALLQHRALDNSPWLFSLKEQARRLFHHLPDRFRTPLRRLVQIRRARRFALLTGARADSGRKGRG